MLVFSPTVSDSQFALEIIPRDPGTNKVTIRKLGNMKASCTTDAPAIA